MSKFTVSRSDDYTTPEDINEVRQLVALIKERPAVKKNGERATLIAYSELAMIEKRLAHALQMIGVSASRTVTTHGENSKCPQVLNGAWDHCKGHDSMRSKCPHGADLNEVCRLCDPQTAMFARPLGASKFLSMADLPEGWTVAQSSPGTFILFHDGVAHGSYATREHAIQSALELDAP